jgi:hypothetical protein
MNGSTSDVVLFDNINAGPATLDVAIGFLQTLQFNDWSDVLTVNHNIVVTGGAASIFILDDGSTIELAANTSLTLSDASPPGGNGSSVWTEGSIIGTATSNFWVSGSSLNIYGIAGPLGVNMGIKKDTTTNNVGSVNIGLMTTNLDLNGNSNFIDVMNGGTLDMNQAITQAGPRIRRAELYWGTTMRMTRLPFRSKLVGF